MEVPLKKGRKFWGEPWWDVLHSGAASYTPDHAQDYLLLVQGYKGNIPCKRCRLHFAQNLINYPIESYLVSAKKLLLWTYIIHDAVNQAHTDESPKLSPSFSSVVEKYARGDWDKSWKFVLHSAAVAYVPDHANDYRLLVKSFGGLIPSPTTRVRFNQALEKCPVEPYLRNNHDLFFWSYLVGNMMLGIQPENGASPQYESVKRYYFSGLGEECKTCDR